MEKNTLWVFGDSNSWEQSIRLQNKKINLETDSAWRYIQEYLGGEIFPCWGKLLSDFLEYNYINHAAYQTDIRLENLPQGNSNNLAINLLNEFADKFKKGDIVIFGFTDVSRFEYGIENSNDVGTFNLLHAETYGSDIIKEILVNRSSYDFYIYDTLQKLKPIEVLSNLVGFEIWYWDWGGVMDRMVLEGKINKDRWIFFQADPNYTKYHDMIYKTYEVGPIHWETNGKFDDHHNGKIASKVHGDVLINFFKNRI